MNIYNQSGFYQVADGSNEYRSYFDELAQYIDESGSYESLLDNWFEYCLIPNRMYRSCWFNGKFNENNDSDFDHTDGNF